LSSGFLKNVCNSKWNHFMNPNYNNDNNMLVNECF